MSDHDAGPTRSIKTEDGHGGSGGAGRGGSENRLPDGSGKPLYKSWKKKYRKMRIVFDQKMHVGEEQYKQEQKAYETANRLAVEVDRILDLLLDINNSPQIPSDKRFDLSLDPPADLPDTLLLRVDDPARPKPVGGAPKSKALRDLLISVGHVDYATAAARSPGLVAELHGGVDSPAADPSRAGHPPSFLTADDIDNYLWETDRRIAAQRRQEGRASSEPPVPTLAPLALAAAAAANGHTPAPPHHHHHHGKDPGGTGRDFALRNPTSVYNWLRKHEPKVFLQDGESGGPATAAAATGENGDDSHHHGPGHGGRGRKSGGGERGGGRGAGAGARASKRASAARREAADADGMDVDDDAGAAGGGGGHEGGGGGGGRGAGNSAAAKRKRPVDDDPGYRPKGGSSRPTKKKRKSEGGGGDSTPTVAVHRRARKSESAVAAAAAAAAAAGGEGDGGRDD